MIEDSFRNYKPGTIRIRLSTPVLVKARCKHCTGLPTIYYYVRNPTLWFNPRRSISQFELIKHLMQRLAGEHFLNFAPKYFTEVSTFSHSINYRNYRPKLHRTRGASAIFDIVEFLTCDCMKTTWAFADKATQNRPEINHRKSRYKFSTKFEY